MKKLLSLFRQKFFTKGKLANHIGEEESGMSENGLIDYSEEEIERWDKEWLNYLLKEYQYQLISYKSFPEKPPLPDNPKELLDLTLGFGSPLYLYCHKEAIEGKNIMEMGCGCGNLGKLISRYCDVYMGVDCSRIALAIAKLVSPSNCIYLHINQHDELKYYWGKMDTIVSRFFWIHQNMEMGKRVLSFLSPFVLPKSRVYMDFFWPNSDKAIGFWKETHLVFSPYDQLSKEPSAVYKYTFEDVENMIQHLNFKIIYHELHGETQRRYIVIEKQD